MKPTRVYCLTLEGTTAIHFDIDALCDAVKMEFEDTELPETTKFEVWSKEMSDQELDELKEFQGF